MAQMQSAKPARKVWAPAVLGALTTIVVYIIEHAGHTKIDSSLLTSINTVLSFLVGYLIPPADTDQVV